MSNSRGIIMNSSTIIGGTILRDGWSANGDFPVKIVIFNPSNHNDSTGQLTSPLIC
jgi:hypothetical protein